MFKCKYLRRISILEILLILMFFTVLVSLVIIWHNTNNTIKIYKSILEFSVNDSISTINFIEKKDTTGYELHFFEKQKLKEELIIAKNYILDANSITFFFEVMTFFTLGLGIYLLGKAHHSIKEAEKFKEKLSLIQSTNTLIRFCENISYLSLSLKSEKKGKQEYNEKNIANCHLIHGKKEDIFAFIEDEQLYELSSKYEKQIIIDLITHSKGVFDTKGLSKLSGYYKQTYNSISQLLEKIKKMKTFS